MKEEWVATTDVSREISHKYGDLGGAVCKVLQNGSGKSLKLSYPDALTATSACLVLRAMVSRSHKGKIVVRKRDAVIFLTRADLGSKR